MICAYFISLLQSKGKGEKAEEKGCHADWSCGAKSSSWVTPLINNIPNNQWHMYLQCQNHSLPSNYNHCRLDVFEKLEQLAFFFLVLNKQLAIVQFKFVILLGCGCVWCKYLAFKVSIRWLSCKPHEGYYSKVMAGTTP